MELIVLNSNLTAIGLVDQFTSIIWTDRYNRYGEFELTAPPDPALLDMIINGRYLSLKESEHMMVLESIMIHSDSEQGNILTAKGRSLETILKQRIVWNPTILTDNFQSGIIKLLNENSVTPLDSDRTYSLLDIITSDDPAVTSLLIDSQFYGEFLYDAISDLCVSRNIGFKLVMTDAKRFEFSLYAGKDRSYNQFDNPYVVFSPEYENVLTSDYTATDEFMKTVTLVAGEKGVGNVRKTTSVSMADGAGTDLQRREMFTDAASVTSNLQGETMSEADYLNQLAQKGMENLAQSVFIETFEGQVDTSKSYKYGEDFFMGDIVQVANEYGQSGYSRVTGIILSEDVSGVKILPTFSAVV